MKKRLLILALLLMSGFALVGCGEELVQGPNGPKGDTGENGKSAYELAVEHGELHSEEDWYDNLTGARGEEGDKGANGTNAANGIEYEIYSDEEGNIYQRVKGSSGQGTMIYEAPSLPTLSENALTPDQIDAMLVSGQKPEGEIIIGGEFFLDKDYKCFRTGAHGTVELADNNYSGYEFVEGKSYEIKATVSEIKFPFFKIDVVSVTEIKPVQLAEKTLVATAADEVLIVFEYEGKHYAAVNMCSASFANKYLIISEVTVEDGKVVNADEYLIWKKTENGDGTFGLSSKKYGTTLGAQNKTALLFGGEGEGYKFSLQDDGGIIGDKSGTRTLCYNSGAPRISTYNASATYPECVLMQAIVK